MSEFASQIISDLNEKQTMLAHTSERLRIEMFALLQLRHHIDTAELIDNIPVFGLPTSYASGDLRPAG